MDNNIIKSRQGVVLSSLAGEGADTRQGRGAERTKGFCRSHQDGVLEGDIIIIISYHLLWLLYKTCRARIRAILSLRQAIVSRKGPAL